MHRIKQGWLIACLQYRRWHRNPKIIMTFLMGLVVSFLLSDKVMLFSQRHDTILQIAEPFIWTFGDADSVMVISLLLMVLFSEMPDLNNHVPFLLVRINRVVWLMGQIFYIGTATFLYMLYILAATGVFSMSRAFIGNMWSETAAILGYSDIGTSLSVPAYVKVMEFSKPYECMVHVFLLMFGYSLLLTGIMLFLNLWRKKGGMIGGIIFTGIGFLLTPQVLSKILRIPREQGRIANIMFGWISPLNHATYCMHSFGYDNLPKLWVSYVFFAAGSLVFYLLSLWKIRKYPFAFMGTGK